MHKRLCALMILLALSLTACGGKSEADQAEELLTGIRGEYLDLAACTGHAAITADYGQRVYSYELDFVWRREGESVLTLTAPENVAGTTARVAAGQTALEYDGVMVETGPLDASGLTPVGAIPALLACAREGYLAECVLEDWDGTSRLHVVSRIPENAPGQGVETRLWFDPSTFALLRGEVSEDGVTVLKCDITGFGMEKEAETE